MYAMTHFGLPILSKGDSVMANATTLDICTW
jgi:hypothetical protein